MKDASVNMTYITFKNNISPPAGGVSEKNTLLK